MSAPQVKRRRANPYQPDHAPRRILVGVSMPQSLFDALTAVCAHRSESKSLFATRLVLKALDRDA